MTHVPDLEARIEEVASEICFEQNHFDSGDPAYHVEVKLVNRKISEFVNELKIKELTEQRAELLTALKETVRWYGLRHDFPCTPLKFIEEQKEPIQAAMRAIAKAECK